MGSIPENDARAGMLVFSISTLMSKNGNECFFEDRRFLSRSGVRGSSFGATTTGTIAVG